MRYHHLNTCEPKAMYQSHYPIQIFQKTCRCLNKFNDLKLRTMTFEVKLICKCGILMLYGSLFVCFTVKKGPLFFGPPPIGLPLNKQLLFGLKGYLLLN